MWSESKSESVGMGSNPNSLATRQARGAIPETQLNRSSWDWAFYCPFDGQDEHPNSEKSVPHFVFSGADQVLEGKIDNAKGLN